MVEVVRWLDSSVLGRLNSDRSGAAARRSQILRAALKSIDAEGPSVGMGRIAERAGIPRPHVYRVFPSKEVLDAEVTLLAATELLGRMRPGFQHIGTLPQIVRGVIEPCVVWAAERPNLYRFVAAQQQTTALHSVRMGRTRLLDEIVAAAQTYFDSGGLQVSVPDGVLAGIIGMVDASTIWWLDNRDESQDEVVDRLSRQVSTVLKDLLSQLGLQVLDDQIFDPIEPRLH